MTFGIPLPPTEKFEFCTLMKPKVTVLPVICGARHDTCLSDSQLDTRELASHYPVELLTPSPFGISLQFLSGTPGLLKKIKSIVSNPIIMVRYS